MNLDKAIRYILSDQLPYDVLDNSPGVYEAIAGVKQGQRYNITRKDQTPFPDIGCTRIDFTVNFPMLRKTIFCNVFLPEEYLNDIR